MARPLQRLLICSCLILESAGFSQTHACPIRLRVYETLDQCRSTQALPNATGILYADGICRRAMDDANASFLHRLFVETVCTTDGSVRIKINECTKCSSTDDGSGCELPAHAADANTHSRARGQFIVSHAELQVPLNTNAAFLDPSPISCFQLERALDDGSTSSTLAYALFGDCSQYQRVQRRSLASSSSPTPSAPLSWRRITQSPTLPPKTITAIRLTHFPTPSGAVSLSTATANDTTPARTPARTTSDTTMASSTVGLELSEMPGLLDATALAAWTDVTEQHLLGDDARIDQVAQQWVAGRTAVAATLTLRFNVTLIVTETTEEERDDDVTSTLAKMRFAQAFDEEKERIQYVRELVRRDPVAFESLNQISVLGPFGTADQDDAAAAGSRTIAPTLDRGDYILPLTLLIAFLISFWICGGLCIMVYAIRRRRCIAAAAGYDVEDGETADMTSLHAASIFTATTPVRPAPPSHR